MKLFICQILDKCIILHQNNKYKLFYILLIHYKKNMAD